MSATAPVKRNEIFGSCTEFLKNARNFMRSCKKPSGREAIELVKGHLVGLCFLGVFGYVIKVVHIPINNIIAGSSS
ncbi:protein transport protein SEC61 subunit gamma [Pancytospora epiphaga]|nr:protein transport protein SEC61 subunit gamma [Pancytospora epiphaga]